LHRNESPASALSTVVSQVSATAPGSRLNLLLTDGEIIAATAVDHALSTLDTGDAVVVASEPYDDNPSWRAVPDNSLVLAKPNNVRIQPIEGAIA
jgi:glutamine amidotransferase